jgi:hypothetical protein
MHICLPFGPTVVTEKEVFNTTMRQLAVHPTKKNILIFLKKIK